MLEAGRHRDPRRVLLWRRDQQAAPAGVENRRGAARRGRHPHRRAGATSCTDLKGKGIDAEIHLHDPDRSRTRPAASCRSTGAGSCWRWPREYGVPIFEDECYADLIWGGTQAPPALYSMDREPGHPYRLVLEDPRAGAAARLLHRRLEIHEPDDRVQRATAAPARSNRWSSPSISRSISTTTSTS